MESLNLKIAESIDYPKQLSGYIKELNESELPPLYLIRTQLLCAEHALKLILSDVCMNTMKNRDIVTSYLDEFQISKYKSPYSRKLLELIHTIRDLYYKKADT